MKRLGHTFMFISDSARFMICMGAHGRVPTAGLSLVAASFANERSVYGLMCLPAKLHAILGESHFLFNVGVRAWF